MSIFFSQIEEIFDNQTREVNFEKINNHYMDKTFRFDINDHDTNTNCFLSHDNEKNFEFLKDVEILDWIEDWSKNSYQNFQNFDIRDIDLESSFKIMKEFDESVEENQWKNNWKDIIEKENKNEILIKKLFDEIFETKIFK